MKAVEVEDLAVSFVRGEGEVAAVCGAGFQVRDGETFGLFGPSGC